MPLCKKRTLFFFCILCASPVLYAQLFSPQKEAILRIHNLERKALSIDPIVWDHTLEQAARVWAAHLATSGLFEHSTFEQRGATGENLWKGSAGHYSVEDMVNSWVSEKRHYQYQKINLLPQNSQNETGHYTQIIWAKTTRIGCALQTTQDHFDVFVCRYAPVGNVVGQYPYEKK